eukprot:snap_masked-scaffold75_size407189-processed-gene-1.6 protein:Tk10126 transcript:snap_masked-scaffold75_size407189-processed-gene-1.6-mRNA-1 annotation:"hypothetical protein L798_11248"
MDRGFLNIQGLASEAPVNSIIRPVAAAALSPPPFDRNNGVYLGMVLAGVGFLLPYNSFIIAVDYFQDKYPGSTIVFDMSLTYIVSAFGSVLLNNMLVEVVSMNFRICFGYAVSFFVLMFITVFEVWLELLPHDQGYHITLAAIALLAVGCTVQQSSFYGYTSMLPTRYTQAVMAGESAAGFIISLSRIITKTLVEDVHINTLYFFSLSLLIVMGCIFSYSKIQDSNVVRYYIQICQVPKESFILRTDLDQISNHAHSTTGSSEEDPGTDYVEVDLEESGPTFGPSCRLQSPNDFLIGFKRGPKRIRSLLTDIKGGLCDRGRIIRVIWPYMLAIALAYFVTLCLFPGIESEITSCSLRSWMPILVMAVFNLTDLIGKILAALPYKWSRPELVLLSWSRILLIPLMIFCATPRAEPLISNEAYSLILSGLLGITNGLFGSVPMIMAPTKVDENQRELAGTD